MSAPERSAWRAAALPVALLAAFVVSLDETLGFWGVDLLGGRMAASIGVVSAAAALAAIAVFALARRGKAVVLAAIVLAFDMQRVPLAATNPLAAVTMAFDGAVPIGFAIIAALVVLRARSVLQRGLACVCVVASVLWAVGALMPPIWLEALVALQTVTLLSFFALVCHRAIDRVAAFFRYLRETADVR